MVSFLSTVREAPTEPVVPLREQPAWWGRDLGGSLGRRVMGVADAVGGNVSRPVSTSDSGGLIYCHERAPEESGRA